MYYSFTAFRQAGGIGAQYRGILLVFLNCNAFPFLYSNRELNLVQVLSEQYYNLIAQEVRNYYNGKVKISPHTFDLYDRLRDLQEVIGIDRY